MTGRSDGATRPDWTTALVRALVDEWARAGLTDAVVAPGSRSTPLTLALDADPRIRLHVCVDERAAGFFALGLALASGRPAAVVCTSGTAVANLHPSVLEAHHARVPLLVCSADRPPELRDTGAGQTVDQVGIFGGALRWGCDPGPPEVATPEQAASMGRFWRSLGARAIAETLGVPPGPVQLNLAFREPLVPTGAVVPPIPARDGDRPWTAVHRARAVPDEALVDRLVAAVRSTPRGLLVAGWGAAVTPATVHRFVAASGWPLLADPISGLRTGDHVVSAYDPLLRGAAFADSMRPDLVLRVGAMPTSKAVTGWLDAPGAPGPIEQSGPIEQWVIDPAVTWSDPTRTARVVLAVDAEALLGAASAHLEAEPVPARDASPWSARWHNAERAARRAIDGILDGTDDPFEGRIARDVVGTVPDGTTVVVASSMPVRDVESFARPRSGVRFVANRGVNGIDGFTSTVLGIAAAPATAGPVVALVGDLCFLHDSNGLIGAARRRGDVTFVVVDNDGGGIFSFLPQAAHAADRFEELFATPTGVDVAALAAVHGVPTSEVGRAGELAPALEASMRAGGVRVVRVRTDRADNVRRHREVWATVERAVAPASLGGEQDPGVQ